MPNLTIEVIPLGSVGVFLANDCAPLASDAAFLAGKDAALASDEVPLAGELPLWLVRTRAGRVRELN